jgi:hypothetical protein
MAFNQTKYVEFFVFRYHMLDGDVGELKKFNNVLNGIMYCCGLAIYQTIRSEISIFDKKTKRKIMIGTIGQIYEDYLYSYDHQNLHPDQYMIDVLQLLAKINIRQEAIDVHKYLTEHPVVAEIMAINTRYGRWLLSK